MAEVNSDITQPTRTAVGAAAVSESDTVRDGRAESAAGLDRGSSIGRYVVLERIGKGGMGVVYRAYDPELERSVALKLLLVRHRNEAKRAQARSRLLREAQALAKLSHPNVIAVHDVGTFEGAVFIAMELVEGHSASRWLKSQKRTRSEILAVFTAAGRGLAAAHDAGLIHRDYKPSNVIVGDDGRVRVLDFGLAKSLEVSGSGEAGKDAVLESPNPSETTGDRLLGAPLTQAGTILGTPKYMAPEQLTGRDVDERTDQFSFCVALYEALYGERPFAAKTVRELALAVTSGRVRTSSSRQVPSWLRRVLLRGLAPLPDERYASMHELLAALARDPSVRRWRVASFAAVAGVTAALVFALVGGESAPVCRDTEQRLAGVWDSTVKDKISEAFVATGRPYAGDSLVQVVKMLDLYTSAWVAMRTDACEATHLRGEQSAQLLDLRMSCLDRRLGQVRALAEVFIAADTDVVDNAVQAVAQLAGLEACADEEFLNAAIAPPSDRETRARVAELHRRLDGADALERAGHYSDGRRVAIAVTNEARALDYSPLLAEALIVLGTLEDGTGDSRTAEATLTEAITVAAAARDDRAAARAWVRLLWVVGQGLAQYHDASTLGLGATAAVARAGNEPPVYARPLNNLAVIPYAQGKYEEARGYYQRILEIRERELDPAHIEVASVRGNLGLVYYKLGDYERASEYHTQALSIRERSLGRDHSLVASTLNNIGINAERQGRYGDAEQAYTRALKIRESRLGADHPGLANLVNNLGTIHFQRQEYELATSYYERAVIMKEKAYGPDHPRLGISLDNLGNALTAQGKASRAVALHERSLEISKKALGADHVDTAYPLTSLGEAYLSLKKPIAAVDKLELALSLRQAAEVPALDIAETQQALAEGLWFTRRQRKRARKLARAALEAFTAGGAAGERGRRRAAAWLAEVGAP